MIDNGIPEELATVMEGGFLTGRDSQGGGNGIRLVGGPIGDTSYAKSFVNDLVEKHAVRLGDLTAFGKSCRYIKPHAAVQLLRFCAVPRINHLVQMAPRSIAQASYRKARSDIISTLLQIVEIPKRTTMPESVSPWVRG
jgi:hypothetical protein